MNKNCATYANYTDKEHLEEHSARACGDTYCGLCRMVGDPTRGAFIRRVEYQVNCRNWQPVEMQLAA